jgi:hypothetical protein
MNKAQFFKYSSVIHGFIEEYKRKLPNAHETRICRGFDLPQTTLLNLRLDTRMVDDQSGGQCDSEDIDQVIARCRAWPQSASTIRETMVFSVHLGVPSQINHGLLVLMSALIY